MAFLDLFTILRRDAIRALSIACLLIVALASQSPYVALGIAVVIVGLFADTIQIQYATRTLRAIAEGDRFVAFPKNWIESRHCLEIAAAGERMRRDLIDADAAIADQRRMLAEARIRREGANFFTTRFHDSVAQAFSTFSQRGVEICATVDSLATFNSGLLRDAHSVSDAVADTANDIQAVSEAAAQIAAIVATTADQIAGSEAATRSTIDSAARVGGWMSRNEIRAEEGMPPIDPSLPDGDGDNYNVPLNSNSTVLPETVIDPATGKQATDPTTTPAPTNDGGI